MNQLIEQIILIIIPIIFSASTSYLFAKLQNKDKNDKEAAQKLTNLEKGIMIIMRDKLRQTHDEYMSRDDRTITASEFESYMDIDEVYTRCGGNHVNIELKEDIKSLRIIH